MENLTGLFEDAHAEIYSMLQNVYADFEKNDYFLQMYMDLISAEAETFSDIISEDSQIDSSASGSIYPMKAYYMALDSVTCTIGAIEKLYEEQIASKRISMSRNKIIRRMVASYCEKRLKIDIPDNLIELRQSILNSNDTASINPRSSIVSFHSAMSNVSQSNSSSSLIGGKRKDELDLF
jgi:hypothetical protein